MKPERLRELAERLAKAIDNPDRLKFYDHEDGEWDLDVVERQLAFDYETATWLWWSLIGPLLDELGVKGWMVCWYDSLNPEINLREPTWLEAAFVAVVEAAEARR